MNKNKKNMLYLGILAFSLFLPHVYAVSFDFELRADKTEGVVSGSTSEVIVSLNNITDTDSGISACLFDINTSGGVSINDSVRSFGSWSYTPGTHSMVDTFESVKSSSDMITIPVKINSNGSLTISNITCSTETEDDVVTEDRSISFSVVSASNSGSSSSSNNNDNNSGNSGNGGSSNNSGTENNSSQNSSLSSNCDLVGIEVNGMSINFDSNTLEYSVYVPDLSSFVLTPFLASDKAKFEILEDEVDSSKRTVKIIVTAENGMTKNYTLFLTNILDEKEDDDTDNITKNNDKKFDYKIIFIGLIIGLVLINIIRIIMKKRRQNTDSE